MTLSHYVGLLRRWGALLVLVGVLAGAAGLVVASRAPAVYEAEATLLVGDVNETVEGLRAASDLTGTYADLLVTDPFLEATAAVVDAPSAAAVRAAVVVTFNAETRVINVSARSGDAESASRIVTGLSTQLQQAADTGGLRPAGEVAVLSRAPERGRLVRTDATLRAALVALSAVTLTFVAAMLLERWRPRVRDVGEASATAERPVLAVLPPVDVAAVARAPGTLPDAYRLLVSKLEADGLQRSQLVVVTGADPHDDGRGVATLLGHALAAAGRRVLVLEDPRGHLDGGSPAAGARTVSAPQAYGLLVDPGSEGVHVTALDLTGPLNTLLSRPLPGLSAEAASLALADVRKDVDVVIVAPGALPRSMSALAWCRAAETVFVVARLHRTTTSALRGGAQALEHVPRPSWGLLLTTGDRRRASGETSASSVLQSEDRWSATAGSGRPVDDRRRIHVHTKPASDVAAATSGREGTRRT